MTRSTSKVKNQDSLRLISILTGFSHVSERANDRHTTLAVREKRPPVQPTFYHASFGSACSVAKQPLNPSQAGFRDEQKRRYLFGIQGRFYPRHRTSPICPFPGQGEQRGKTKRERGTRHNQVLAGHEAALSFASTNAASNGLKPRGLRCDVAVATARVPTPGDGTFSLCLR